MIKKNILYRVTKLNELDKHSPVNLRNQKKPEKNNTFIHTYKQKVIYKMPVHERTLIYKECNQYKTRYSMGMTKDFLCFGIGHNLIHS